MSLIEIVGVIVLVIGLAYTWYELTKSGLELRRDAYYRRRWWIKHGPSPWASWNASKPRKRKPVVRRNPPYVRGE